MRNPICLLILMSLVSVELGAAVTNVFTASGTQINRRIPPQGDGGTGDLSKDRTVSTIAVTGLPADHVIGDANVTLNITHPFVADLVVELVSPSGYTNILAYQRGAPGANFTGTIFDDEAAVAIGDGTAPFTGRFRPDGPMSDFDGTVANGTWTLRVEDTAIGDSGTLVGWSLTLVTDTSRPPVTVDDAQVVEGNAGSATVTTLVRLGAAAPVPVTVSYATANDTAVAGVDYTAGSGTVTFNPGEVLKVISFTVRGDVEIEGTESFLVNLSNPIGAILGDGQARVTILNDDPTGSTRTFQASGGQVGLPIPPVETGGSGDAVKDTTRSQITVTGQPDDAVVADLDVTVSLIHAYDQDVVLRLVSPVGTVVLLSDQRGWGGTNSMAATFDDQSTTPISLVTSNLVGTFRPEQLLSRVVSNRVNGTWTLQAEDVGFGDTGTLLGWSMRVVSVRTNALAVPALDVALAGNNVVLSWPSPSPASVLEATSLLTPSGWTNTGWVPVVINGRNTVTVPVAGEERHFRLRILQ